MSAPGDTREGWQQLDHRQPGNYEGQRGPTPRQEGPLVGEGEAGIRFGIPVSLRGSPPGSLAAPGASAPMILMAVTRLSLLHGVAHGIRRSGMPPVQWTSCHGS